LRNGLRGKEGRLVNLNLDSYHLDLGKKDEPPLVTEGACPFTVPQEKREEESQRANSPSSPIGKEGDTWENRSAGPILFLQGGKEGQHP